MADGLSADAKRLAIGVGCNGELYLYDRVRSTGATTRIALGCQRAPLVPKASAQCVLTCTNVVETMGFEPTTPCLQTRSRGQMRTSPNTKLQVSSVCGQRRTSPDDGVRAMDARRRGRQLARNATVFQPEYGSSRLVERAPSRVLSQRGRMPRRRRRLRMFESSDHS